MQDGTPLVIEHRAWLETTTLCVGLARGSRDDPPGHAGAAHLFEHLIMSARGTGRALTDLVEDRGGTANASSDHEVTLYYARVANEDVPEVAAALWQAVESPQITEADLAREKSVVVQEIIAARADASDRVQDDFLADLFGPHPIGRPVAGSPEEMEGLTLGDLHTFQTLAAPRHCLIAVGGADPGAIRNALAPSVLNSPADVRHFEPREPRPAQRAADAPWPDGEFSWVVAGGHAVSAHDPDRASYTVLSALMGGSPASLLYRALRDEAGLAYTFQAWSSHYSDAGAWRVLMGVESVNGPQAVGSVERLLERLARHGPTPQEHSAALRRAVGQCQRDAEDPWQLAIDTALRTDIGRLPWSSRAERAALLQVTPDHIRSAAAQVADSFRVTVRA
jgi:predicted Zn-dependent peptidase